MSDKTCQDHSRVGHEPQHKVPNGHCLQPFDRNAIGRLAEIDWDFTTADTGYLTHNLHPYPAKFIPQIPNALIRELSAPGETVADIFCGSGTTLLEALRLNRNTVGIDANPLAVLISRAKTTPLQDSDFNELVEHRETCASLLGEAKNSGQYPLPDGDPLQRPAWRPPSEVCEFWFEPHVVEELANLRLLIDGIHDNSAKIVSMVALSAIIVRVSKQDSDTRYVRREKNVKPGDTTRYYIAQLDGILPALRRMSDCIKESLDCKVLEANLLDTPDTPEFDLVVTSPPYPNAYSYHLYHRTRLVWLGFDPEKFKKIEIGSHRKYSSKGRNGATSETFLQEFETIFGWLRERLKYRGHACFIIGDSTVRKERIDNASLIARAGATHGFREVARIARTIRLDRKAFNPAIGNIKTEKILVLQRA